MSLDENERAFVMAAIDIRAEQEKEQEKRLKTN
jgi:hypothetical protein